MQTSLIPLQKVVQDYYGIQHFWKESAVKHLTHGKTRISRLNGLNLTYSHANTNGY
jgi:hypothetical protein